MSKKHTITIDPATYLGWNLSYRPDHTDNWFVAEHPEKRGNIYRDTLPALLQAIDKREEGLCRLKEPIPVAIKSHSIHQLTDAEIFAYDRQCYYLRTTKGEVLSEFFSNLRNNRSITLRLRDENYEDLKASIVVADMDVQNAIEARRELAAKFVNITAEAITSAPYTKDEIHE